MAHVGGIYAVTGQQLGLEGKDAQHMVGRTPDFLDAIGTPGPDRRADEMHGLDARSPQVGFQAQVEVGRIDADKNGWRLLEQALAQLPADVQNLGQPAKHFPAVARSEERRVGKECRSRWSPYH